jgi:hypothetical protein
MSTYRQRQRATKAANTNSTTGDCSEADDDTIITKEYNVKSQQRKKTKRTTVELSQDQQSCVDNNNNNDDDDDDDEDDNEGECYRDGSARFEKNTKPKKYNSKSTLRVNTKKLAAKVQLDDEQEEEIDESIKSRRHQQQSRKARSTRDNANSIMKEFEKLIGENFSYSVKQVDFNFVYELYTNLPNLKEIWDRIGFNKETKSQRLDKFYHQLHVLLLIN